jgi:hypothetical protein
MFVALEDWHDDMADVLEMSLFAEASSHVQLVTLVADVCWAGHFLSETFRSRWPCCVDVPMAPGLHV